MPDEKINIAAVDAATKELRSNLSQQTDLSEFEKMLAAKNLVSELENQISIRMQSAMLYSVLAKR
ncbi:hypothetical protein [Vibrio diazotrophicus]|uniref:hypothetical protein n=1 Tax=Vibrio diazotrophicus TaxID=685 RepID=UPI000C9DC8A9|nr:hypothetical protein [Vibrio diazotrophicus]PNH93093.1 hypothetical protein C1M59_07740 [Vibrio diazotrophicus]